MGFIQIMKERRYSISPHGRKFPNLQVDVYIINCIFISDFDINYFVYLCSYFACAGVQMDLSWPLSPRIKF